MKYANFTDKAGDTFYYINVENSILGGTNFTHLSAKNKGISSFGTELSDTDDGIYDVPTMLGSDEIFIFIDHDYDSSTGYMVNSIGADQLLHIVGHYGIITSSTISYYNGIDNSWNWIGKTPTPAANDYNEIEILGSEGNYYFYITSWDNSKDDIESEIYQKIILSDDNPDEGSRADPSIPAWNSANWRSIDSGADNNDASTDAVDILNTADEDRDDNLMYYSDGEYMYFMMFLEGDPDPTQYTYGVVMNDGASDNNYDKMVCTYYSTCL